MKSLSHCVPLLISAFLLTVIAAPLSAQNTTTAREPVERDLGPDHFIAGGTVSVSKSVAGDLAAAGGNVDVAAEVGGDALVAGGNVRLGASIKQGLYAAGGRVSVNGPVQRNARIAGGTVEIGPQARIAGNVIVGGGEVRITGAIDGYLQASGGHVVIDGPVGGDVEVASGSIELGPNARINGRLRYASRDELRRDPAAEVKGGIERFSPRAAWPVPSDVQERAGRGAGWVWTVGLMVIAAILVAALPGVYTGIGSIVRGRWPLSLLVGFIALVCIPVAALIAMFTVIGVPLALVMIALYLALLLVGYVSAGVSAGEAAVQRWQAARASQTSWRIAAAVLGMLAVSLLGRLPWIGGLVVFAAMLLGIGALLMQLAPTRATKTG
ncbi:polymer-forming cytoskeletal protein [Candidatus Nitrotoga sp. 1052]|uniref:polymer-forming cytoskeletal protein n=1 Tax=Candidatus Nitrotoga sp. 1052 TaxID=2886964 RepID=UPI001EF59509|nr:polymer-forming cytoskeletal protein [Candidatus Nitrotoga sp. 1052]CAH1091708.1 Polymer-forming cytoskeletal protein [Candidatus Nitrotoga sp. 1052]